MRLTSLIIVAIVLISKTYGLGTMSIDIGNEFMKVAIVKSGVPMEIVLDKESQRKTPTVISIREKERLFGNSAEALSVRYPADTYQYIPSLIGKDLDHHSVKLFKTRFPFYDLDFDNESAQLVFKRDDKILFTVEELYAMLLDHARENAEAHADEPIKSAVITVPNFFGQAERRAVLRAASLVNLDVHQLINEDTSVALHFGVFRKAIFNGTAQYYLFFNMGSQSTTATLVAYQIVKDKSGSIAVDMPELTVLGFGFDESLGITEFAIRLRDHFAQEFKKQTKLDATKDFRALGKLFKEAKRVVKILSANTETVAQVEYLMKEKDFKLKVTRSDLETLCQDLFTRIRKPIDDALEAAQMAMPLIKEVILMGGGTRMPKVQETIITSTGVSELGRSINTDEASVLGAVYQSAFHSPGFRVVKFNIKDFNQYPLHAKYEVPDTDEVEQPEGPQIKLKMKETALYKRGNPFPQNRKLTINKRARDMSVAVDYADLDMPFSRYLFGHKLDKDGKLMKIHLTEVASRIEPELKTNALMRGFKVHFRMDFSGILSVTGVDAHLELPTNATESAFGRLGKKITDLFSAGTEESASTEEKEKDPRPEEQMKPEQNSTKSETMNNETVKADKTDTEAAKPKTRIVPIDFTVNYIDSPTPSDKVMNESKDKLTEIRSVERAIAELERSKNDLESFIFKARDSLDSSSFTDHSTEEDRKSISKMLTDTADWYEEQGPGTKKEDFDKQLEMIKSAIRPIEDRVFQTNERPKAFKKLWDTLDHAKTMADYLNLVLEKPTLEAFFPNVSSDFPLLPIDRYREDVDELVRNHVEKVFTKAEIEALKNSINDHQKWHEESEEVIKTEPKHKDSSITVTSINERHGKVIEETRSYKEKFDNNRHTIQIEVRKLIRAKQAEQSAKEEAQKTTDESKKLGNTTEENETTEETKQDDKTEGEDKTKHTEL